LLVSGLVFLSYGLIAYSIFTNRSGLHGNLYWYYRVDRVPFALYQLVMSLAALTIITRILYFTILENPQKLKRTFIHFALFILVLIVCEAYLNTRYVGKG